MASVFNKATSPQHMNVFCLFFGQSKDRHQAPSDADGKRNRSTLFDVRVQLILSYNVIGHKASRDENDQTSRKQRASTLRHMRLTLPIRKSDSKGKKKKENAPTNILLTVR